MKMTRQPQSVYLLRYAFLLMALALVAACSQLGLATPATFPQKVAAGYAVVQTVNESALNLLKAGKLNKTDAQNVVDTSKAALEAIDLARSTYATNPTGAENKLVGALTVLTALQTYLATKGG